MAIDYPRISKLSGGLNDDEDDALRTLLTDVAPSNNTLKFVTDKNATVIQTQIYREKDLSRDKTFSNINQSGASINDTVNLSGADSTSNVYEYNFKVEPANDDSDHNILGSLGQGLTLKMNGNPSSDILNDAKILNNGNFKLNFHKNDGLTWNGDLSDANLSATLSTPSLLTNIQAEEWTVSNEVAKVNVMDAGVGQDENNDNNVYYMRDGLNQVLSNAAAQDYNLYFDQASKNKLQENFGTYSNLDVVIQVSSSTPTLEENNLVSLLDVSMNNVNDSANASNDIDHLFIVNLSRDENLVAYNDLSSNRLNVSRLYETLPVEASGNAHTDLVVEFDSSDRVVVDCSASTTASVNYSTLSEANKTTENVSFTLSKERNHWHTASSAFYTSDASYNESERVANVNLVSLSEDRVFKLSKQDIVTLLIDPSNSIKQVDFSATDLSNNKQIDVCGSVVVGGTVQAGLDLTSSLLRVLFESNDDSDAAWDSNGSHTSVTNASVDLTGITHWDIAVNDDFFDAVNRSYSYVLNSADSADPGSRIIFQNEVGTRASTGLHLQALTVTSNRKSQNRVTNSNSPISIFIDLNDSNIVDYSYNVVRDNQSGTSTVTHTVKIKKHFVAGLGGLASVSRDFYQYTIVAEYDASGDLITSGNKFDQDGFANVSFNVNAYTHSAKLIYGSTVLAGPINVDFRVMSKGFVLDLEDHDANVNINSINLSILEGGRNAKVHAKNYELVLTKDSNNVKYLAVSKTIDGLSIPDLTGSVENFVCQTTGAQSLRLKDLSNNNLLDLSMNMLLSYAPENIYVVVRRNALWKVNNNLVSKSGTSGTLQFQMADGVTLDVSVSSLFDHSLNQFHTRDFKLGHQATVTLNNDKFKVTRWTGDASGSLQLIPSNKVLLDQSGVTQVSANFYRGFANGSSLRVSRNNISLNVLKNDLNKTVIKNVSINPLVVGQTRDVNALVEPFSVLNFTVENNPDGSNNNFNLNMNRPSVYLAVCPGGSTQKIASATSSHYDNLLFSNMFGLSGESLKPFTDMLFLNNIVCPTGTKIKMEIRSSPVIAVSGAGDVSFNIPLDGTSTGLLPSGYSAPARLSVRVDPSNNLRLDAKSVVFSVQDSQVDIQFRDENGLDNSVTKNLIDLEYGLSDLTFDGDHVTGNYAFDVSGLVELLNDPSSVSQLYYTDSSFVLNVENNLFSIYRRHYDPTDSTWERLTNQPSLMLDKKQLTSDSFSLSNSKYVWSDPSFNQVKISFSNPMQRPLALDGSNELYDAGNKKLRFESWHLEQSNDASGVERMFLVHSHSQLLNLSSNGNVVNFDNYLIENNGRKWLQLQSIEVEKNEVIGPLEPIYLENISSYDKNGVALPPWPQVDPQDYHAHDVDLDHDGSYNDHHHLPNSSVRMMTIGFSDENEFYSQLVQSDRKTGSQGNVAYRIILQDLLHVRDHNQMLALRIDPAGGLHTNAIYTPNITNVNGGVLAPMPPATGLNVSV